MTGASLAAAWAGGAVLARGHAARGGQGGQGFIEGAGEWQPLGQSGDVKQPPDAWAGADQVHAGPVGAGPVRGASQHTQPSGVAEADLIQVDDQGGVIGQYCYQAFA